MAPIRTLLALLLTAGLAAPLALPVIELARSPGGWGAWADAGRIAGLAGNTFALALGAVAVSVPAGVVAAVLLERVNLPGRSFLRGVMVVGLFVPLPVYAVAWQVVLGSWLPAFTLGPGRVAWRPWSQGLFPAAWVHGAAGLPWVVWIVGAVLRTADRGLEEDALSSGGPAAVFRRVVGPRAALAGVAAAGWVAVQSATEIVVTDAMMVRTFAEEVYTQFVGASDGLAGAVAVTIPAWLAAVAFAVVVVRRTAATAGRPQPGEGGGKAIPVGRVTRLAATLGLWAGAFAFAGLPLAALVWKAGGGGTRPGWGLETQAGAVGKVLRSDGGILVGSAGTAAVTGVVAAGLAWVACRAADDSPWFTGFLFGLCVLLWVTPGPLVGLGLKDAIEELLSAEDWLLERTGHDGSAAVLRPVLYDRPSPGPAFWAGLVRLFPVAVAVLWPATRAVPRDLLDAAKLDGLGVRGEWRNVVVPLTGGAAARAAVAVAALALGEVSATKLVNPPGRAAYVLRLFDQMHYGAESTVAASALIQVAATALVAGLLLRRAGAGKSR